ncbi:fatty acid--CoA ligase [Bacterioplanoides sp.]|uniref:fatty acid--CoA ligase n=1 Tax=Bacterioplanoides sp. TaxID=2066072 RepID=UPI003B58F74C
MKFQRASSAYNYPLLIKSLLTSDQRYEEQNAIVYRGVERFSYKEFNERVCKLANVLKDLGVKPGDAVAVLDWDSHRYLECYFAVPMIGAILHTVNIRLSPDQVLYTINHAEDAVLLVHDDFFPMVDSIYSEFETVRGIVRLNEFDQPEEPTSKFKVVGEYEGLLSKASKQYEFPDFDEDTVATLFYTTGTTGNPKGVFFSHRQLVLHTLHVVNALSTCSLQPILGVGDVYMPITPMFHVHAWGIPYAATMMGVQQVYPGCYEPDAIVRLIREEGVTFSHCVPTILQMVMDSGEAQDTDFSGWSVIIGGSQLTESLALKALELGIEPFVGYGMSETCPIMSLTKISPSLAKLPSRDQIPYRVKAGQPTVLVDIDIWDASNNPLPHDGLAVGEVVVRSPWLTQGYLKESEKSEELWQGGWLHTGDIACIHPNGFIEIRDRIKDVIKTGGEWVSSLELENLICQHPLVSSAAVIGIPDERWGERPYAIIVPESDECDKNLIQIHLEQFVKAGKINKWAIPQVIDFVNEIPKTSVGKIDKKRIRRSIGRSY